MKRRTTKGLGLPVMFLFLTATVLIAQPQAKAPGEMRTQVAKSHIRASPSVIAPILATLEYRARVFVYEGKDGWAKVQVPGSNKVGYMFLSSLAEKSLPAAGVDAAAPGVSGSEVALAGKGFIAAAEESYKKSAHADYSRVDAMEAAEYSPASLLAFLSGAR